MLASMATQKPARRSECPISYSLDIFGDRWTLLVVRDLALTGKKHFRDFLDSDEGIASNILADRLKTLECFGIVTRHPDPEHASKVIYSLTEKGMDLIPALFELVRWGVKYDDKTRVPKEFVQRIEKERDQMVAEAKAALRARQN
jgi:DNA-binding HxlR family transcriptional regulator